MSKPEMVLRACYLEQGYDTGMVLVIPGNMIDPEKDSSNKSSSANSGEQQWDNPTNPENASDSRDNEQMERQKKEAEIRKANLTEPGN